MSRRRALLELVLAVLAAVGSVAAWVAAISEEVVAPVLAGEPSTVSRVYSAPMLTLSLMLATLAGVLVVVSIARMRRAPTYPAN